MIVLFVLAHVVTTLIAYGIGCMIFGSSSPYVIGLVLFAAIPMGISSALWVGLSSGSVPWIVSMIVLDSLLSPIVVPMTMHALFGATLELNGGDIRNKLFFIIVLPTLVGVLVNEVTKGRVKEWAAPVSAPLSKIAFVGVVMLNASAIAPEMDRLQSDVWMLIPVVVGFVALCYFIGYGGAYFMRRQGIFVEFSYASGMRNISLGVVIGLGYFSPLASIPVILAILVQQPMATLNYYVHKRLQNLNNKKLENR
jgi:predicted Na+-dependent transporter